MHGLDLVAHRAQCGDQFAGEVLVQQYPHAACSSLRCANSRSTPRTDSAVKLG